MKERARSVAEAPAAAKAVAALFIVLAATGAFKTIEGPGGSGEPVPPYAAGEINMDNLAADFPEESVGGQENPAKIIPISCKAPDCAGLLDSNYIASLRKNTIKPPNVGDGGLLRAGKFVLVSSKR